MSTHIQPVTNRSKDTAMVTQELHRKLFLERMERKLAFKEAIYSKLYNRRRPRKEQETVDSPITEFLRIPAE
jgi:hypothetical protein